MTTPHPEQPAEGPDDPAHTEAPAHDQEDDNRADPDDPLDPGAGPTS
jgi:hypothetical protein